MEKHQYTKILTENTTKAYNKSNQKKISNISFTAKNITEKLSIDDRVQRMEELDSYITVKDHKDEFSHKIPLLLINLSKSNLGKSSKVILNKINQHLVTFTNINQWKNTQNLLNWFYKIQKKKKKKKMLHSKNLILKTFIHLLQWNCYINLFSFQKKQHQYQTKTLI